MNIRISAAATSYLRRLDAKGRTEGKEIHAYALGGREEDEVRIIRFISAGRPRASGAMVEPDFAASAKALLPHLERGEHLLGEAHSHLSLIGPSSGDLRTLADISDQYPGYLCLVIAPKHQISAHTVEDGRAIAHTVTSEEYPLLDPKSVQAKNALVIGAGSGLAAAALPLCKIGFRAITIADRDTVEARNLQRHFATTRDIGKAKVNVFKRFVLKRTTSRIRTINAALTSETRARFEKEIKKHDVIINATGHPVVSRTLSHLARQASKPVVHAGVFERGSGGFVFLDLPNGPCYSCLFPLNLAPEADDAETMRTLTEQYGLTEDELSAQLGLWMDVNVIASIQIKVLLEYLKGKTTPHLYLIENDRVTIEQHTIGQREDCICTGGNE
jgi:molybdopterin/thiamine biosynthesis adenylyltransferase